MLLPTPRTTTPLNPIQLGQSCICTRPEALVDNVITQYLVPSVLLCAYWRLYMYSKTQVVVFFFSLSGGCSAQPRRRATSTVLSAQHTIAQNKSHTCSPHTHGHRGNIDATYTPAVALGLHTITWYNTDPVNMVFHLLHSVVAPTCCRTVAGAQAAATTPILAILQ